MLDVNNSQILFINGINTAFGGSVAESNKVWIDSFRQNKINVTMLDSVPTFGYKKRTNFYLFLLSVYFIPGTLFRVFKAPIMEFLYKLSPLLFFRLILNLLSKRFRKVIFSHHSIFYLAIFCARRKRVFLVQDLIYIRARSRGFRRRAQRIFFFIELYIYKLAPTILVQSYHEWRLLTTFLDSRIILITCCNLRLAKQKNESKNDIAVVSDWRRQENIHGAIEFFLSGESKKYSGSTLRFSFYGFGSSAMVHRMSLLLLSSNIKIIDGGAFNKLSDLTDIYFFVPIYHGAGIKRKTLDAICNGRMVLGTKAAFIGLPPWIISKVTYRVRSISDLQKLPKQQEENDFVNTILALSKKFHGIGDINDLWK